jgi:deoxyribonuclease V
LTGLCRSAPNNIPETVMEIRVLHDWNLTSKQAMEVQSELKRNLKFIPFKKNVNIAVGVDVSSAAGSDLVFAAAVAWNVNTGQVVEVSTDSGTAIFPYIPGFLAFRELPVIVRALEKIGCAADVIIVDGHGISHPRGLGIASHLGLMVDVPTIGCAKKKLVGEYEPPGMEKFDHAPLVYKGETVGAVLRSRANVKPVFVSPGNMIDLQSSIDIVKKLIGRYRIPEPLRWAHIQCNNFRTASNGIG